MSYLHNAASVTPPVSGSDDMVVLGSSDTAAVFQIPATWLTCHITIEADGADCYLAFTKDSTLALDGTDVTTLDADGAIDTHGTAEGVKVADGGSKSFNLAALPGLASGERWYLAHVESAASAYVRINKSSGRATLPA